jgi:hypothetical protein
MATKKPLKEQLFVPDRMAIVYHNPNHPLAEQVIQPGDERIPKEGLPFDHLDNEDIAMLLRKRILKPAPVQKKEQSKAD